MCDFWIYSVNLGVMIRQVDDATVLDFRHRDYKQSQTPDPSIKSQMLC